MTKEDKFLGQVEKARRGFAAMSVKQRADISRKGGKAAHAKGTAHEWNQETAAAAGRLGGTAAATRKREG